MKILDYGCGKGYRAEKLAKGNEYWGIDISPENIQLAKTAFPGQKFILTDGNQIPVGDGYFDAIYVYDVLEHVADLDATLNELYRCLKYGGKLICELPFDRSERYLLWIHPGYHAEVGHLRVFTEEKAISAIGKHGFKLLARSRKKGIDNLLLTFFYLSGRKIMKNTGDFDRENIVMRKIALFFSEEYFDSKLSRLGLISWLFFPVLLFSQPIGRLLSVFFPKSIHYEFVKVK